MTNTTPKLPPTLSKPAGGRLAPYVRFNWQQAHTSVGFSVEMCVGLLHVKSGVVGQTSSRRCGAEFRREVPAQVLFSSSDSVSWFRGPSQNSPPAASKRDVDVTKQTQELNYFRRIFLKEKIFRKLVSAN
ncbi:hypothetical protein AVEN_70130-1 [Araneus ventricosus]|uniref:Uncharacterized protein n=1 Tax=Araneus ventricosus TaxID=182803 RepID=A0A4Y2EHC4_ARAVE|nr:hypothetical protein AVEN_70130-1 [Araneus ventricosus]